MTDPTHPIGAPVRATHYPPCRGRRLHLLIAQCPECAEFHLHRAGRLPAEGLVRQPRCGASAYRLLPVPPRPTRAGRR